MKIGIEMKLILYKINVNFYEENVKNYEFDIKTRDEIVDEMEFK